MKLYSKIKKLMEDLTDLEKAKNPSTSPEELDDLIFSYEPELRKAAALNPNISPKSWKMVFAGHPEEAMSNPAHDLFTLEDPTFSPDAPEPRAKYIHMVSQTNPDRANALLNNSSLRTRSALSRQPDLHPNIIQNLLDNKENSSYEIARNVAKSPNITPDQLHKLWTNYGEISALEHPNVMVDTLKNAYNNVASGKNTIDYGSFGQAIAHTLIRNPKTPSALINHMAGLPKLPEETITNLLKRQDIHPDHLSRWRTLREPYIRGQIALHPNTKFEDLLKLKDDAVKSIARNAQATLDQRRETQETPH